MAAQSEHAASEPRRYALFALTGRPRMLLTYPGEGVTIDAARIGWATEHGQADRALDDVSGIHLSIGHIPRSGEIGSCVVSFANGDALTVISGNGWGAPDEERAATYAAFLRDLHDAVAVKAQDRVRYLAGVSESRHAGMKVVSIVAGVLFVALPLILLAIMREIEFVFVTLAGAAFVVPLFAMIEKNRPRSYAPDRIPPELMP